MDKLKIYVPRCLSHYLYEQKCEKNLNRPKYTIFHPEWNLDLRKYGDIMHF